MKTEIKKFFIGGLSLSLVNLSQKAVNFLLLPLFTFYLSPKEFGLIGIYFLVIGILSMLYNPGVISSTSRLFYDSEKTSVENERLIATSMVFLLFLPFIILILSLFFGEAVFRFFFREVHFWPYGFLAICSALMVQPIRLWTSYYIILGKTKLIAIGSAIQLIISVLISLLLVVQYELGALGRIYGLLLGNLILFIIALKLVFTEVGFKVSFNKIKHILKVGFPLIIGVFSYVILDISDRYMISSFMELESLGAYDISYTISSIPLFIVLGFNQVWQPLLYENMKIRNHEVITQIIFYFISGFSFITSLVILFSNEIFNLLIDKSFHEGLVIVPWIMSGIFFLGLTNFLNSILMYDKKFSQTGIISITAAIINILSNLVLIPLIGILGAAIATFIAYLAYCIILLFITKDRVYELFAFKKLSIFIVFLLVTNLIVFFLNLEIREFNFNIFLIKALTAFISGLILINSFFALETQKLKTYLQIRLAK